MLSSSAPEPAPCGIYKPEYIQSLFDEYLERRREEAPSTPAESAGSADPQRRVRREDRRREAEERNERYRRQKAIRERLDPIEQEIAGLEDRRAELAELRGRYELLDQRYTGVQDELVQLRRQLSIDDSAYAKLRSELELSNNQLAEMTGELKFYRSIISPQEGKHGVSVQEISITQTERPGTFRYKLILIQTLQKGKELKATVKFSIKGESGGEQKVIEHPDPGEEKLKVQFKYFQSLTGTFDLPDAFMPLEVRVDLSAKKNKSLIDEKWYPWSDVASMSTS